MTGPLRPIRVSVLMACHNRRETTLRCLRSLRVAVKRADDGRRRLATDVFLVDDGSTDGTGDAVRECAESLRRDGEGRMAIHLVHGDGNLYWAKGMALAWRESLEFEKRQRNQAEAENNKQRCEAASCESSFAHSLSLPDPSASASYHSLPLPPSSAFFSFSHFLWLNDDAELDADSLVKLLDVDDGECLVVGNLRDAAGREVYGLDVNGWMNGNCVLVPRNVYERVGVICGLYSHAWADGDYALRAKRAGVRIVGAGVVGRTEWHPLRPDLREMDLKARWRSLSDPKGWNLHDLWLYRRRNWGRCAAAASCAHLFVHVLIGR